MYQADTAPSAREDQRKLFWTCILLVCDALFAGGTGLFSLIHNRFKARQLRGLLRRTITYKYLRRCQPL